MPGSMKWYLGELLDTICSGVENITSSACTTTVSSSHLVGMTSDVPQMNLVCRDDSNELLPCIGVLVSAFDKFFRRQNSFIFT